MSWSLAVGAVALLVLGIRRQSRRPSIGPRSETLDVISPFAHELGLMTDAPNLEQARAIEDLAVLGDRSTVPPLRAVADGDALNRDLRDAAEAAITQFKSRLDGDGAGGLALVPGVTTGALSDPDLA